MKYSINLDKNIIYCEISHSFVPKELIEFITEIRNDTCFHNGLNTITDLRKANFPEDYIGVSMIADYIQNTASLYKTLTYDKSVKVCVNDLEAEEWLTIN